MSPDNDKMTANYAEAKSIYLRLKELHEHRGAADMASIDLMQVREFTDEWNKLMDRAKELGYMDLNDMDSKLAPKVPESKEMRLEDLGTTFSEAASSRKRLTPEQMRLFAGARTLGGPIQFKEPLKLADLAGAMKELFGKVDYFFKLEDIFEIFQWCVNGDYDLESAIRAVCGKVKRTLYLVQDDKGRVHGAFVYDALAKHYAQQFEKVGQRVEIVEVPFSDYTKVTELQAYELNLVMGSTEKKGNKIYTFNPDAFLKIPVVSFEDHKVVHRNDVEHMIAVVPAEGSDKFVEDFVKSVNGKYKFGECTADTYLVLTN